MIALPRRGIARPPLGEPFRLNRNSPQARGLVGWWPSRYPGANTLPDMSGYGNDGAFQNTPEWTVSAPMGHGITCVEGDSDWIDVGGYPDYSFTDNFSFGGWFKVSSYPSGWHGLMTYARSASVLGYALITANPLLAVYMDGGSGTGTNAKVATNPAVDTWFHFMAVRRAGTNYIYLNGVEEAATCGRAPGHTSANGLAFNRLAYDTDNYYNNATIGDTRIYNRALSAAEIWQLYDPSTRWELYDTAVSSKLWVVVEAGGAYSLEADAGSYTYTGVDPTLTVDRDLSLDAGSYTYTGVDADLLKGFHIDVDTGTYTYTGVDPTLTVDRTLELDVGSYTLTGVDPNLLKGFHIDVDVGSYTLTGIDPTLTVDRTLGLDVGSYTLTGIDPDLLKGFHVDVDVGTYTLTGVDPTITADRQLGLDTGTYTLTGPDANLLRGFLLSADAGNYTLTGIDCTLTYAGGTTYTLTCDAGSYSLTGVNAALLFGHSLSADTGVYTLTGPDVDLLRGLKLSADTGSYTLTGVSMSPLIARILDADAGSYDYTGADIAVVYSAATFDVNADRAYVVKTEDRVFIVLAEDRFPVIDDVDRTHTVLQ